jgi:tryptophan synthase alpha chain
MKDFAKKDKIKFMPFYMAGYPTIEESINNIKTLDKYADILEIGIPFSDPSADGVVVQSASQVAIQNGFNTSDVFDVISKVKANKSIVILCYLNTTMQYGIEKFMKDASNVSVQAILCPDLPPEHRKMLTKYADKYNIDIVHIISTNTSIERVKFIDSIVNSFIYLVSKPSITGGNSDIPQETIDYINKIKPIVKNPLYIGFGISNRDHINKIKSTDIDGFIIGSKIISLKGDEIEKYLQNVLL